jgi:hypothetical protein
MLTLTLLGRDTSGQSGQACKYWFRRCPELVLTRGTTRDIIVSPATYKVDFANSNERPM